MTPAPPRSDHRPVPVHPEPVSGRPDLLRWVVPAGTLPLGAVRRAPGRLGELLARGDLADACAERAALWLRLAHGSWRSRGAEVRSALQEALLDPDGWDLAPPDDTGLRLVVDDVLAGPVGDYVRSHGGRIEVARVRDGVLELELSGACGHCPVAGLTLHGRIETAVRDRWPALVAVRPVGSRAAGRGSASGIIGAWAPWTT